jgi:CHAD domain-containing protein
MKHSVMRKAEQGPAMVDGTAPARKAEPVQVERSMTVAQGFETIVGACLHHFQLNQPVVINVRDVEALHQLRVAIRRLRSGLTLFRPAVADHEFEHLHGELRWLMAESGDARNLDVYLHCDLTHDQRSFVENRRTDAYDRAISALRSARCRRLMLDMVAWASAGQWRENAVAAEPLGRFANDRIVGLWSKVVDSRRLGALTDTQRHRLRIRVKKLRYALEFVDALHDRKTRRKRRFRRALKKAQDSLGDLHDMVTARSLVTLNSWLRGPDLSRKAQRRLVRDADRRLARLRDTDPYWN